MMSNFTNFFLLVVWER